MVEIFQKREIERLFHVTIGLAFGEFRGEIDGELFGSAASDYVRAAVLEEEKETLEERLLAIYEEIGV